LGIKSGEAQGTLSVAVQCKGTTKAGPRYKRKSKNKNGHCFQYEGQQIAPTSSRVCFSAILIPADLDGTQMIRIAYSKRRESIAFNLKGFPFISYLNIFIDF